MESEWILLQIRSNKCIIKQMQFNLNMSTRNYFINNKFGCLKNDTTYYKNRTIAGGVSGGVEIYITPKKSSVIPI